MSSRIGAHMVTPEALRHIARHLRSRDRAEIFALRWTDDEEVMVRELCAVAGELWRVWSWDGEPVAVNGVVPVRPGVVIAGAFGTDKWRLTIKAMTRWSRDFVIPVLQNSNYHRGEAYVLASHTDSRRWIEMLGGQVEALLQGYGRNREDFLLYVWDLTKNRRDQNVPWRRQHGEQWRQDGRRH